MGSGKNSFLSYLDNDLSEEQKDYYFGMKENEEKITTYWNIHSYPFL